MWNFFMLLNKLDIFQFKLGIIACFLGALEGIGWNLCILHIFWVVGDYLFTGSLGGQGSNSTTNGSLSGVTSMGLGALAGNALNSMATLNGLGSSSGAGSTSGSSLDALTSAYSGIQQYAGDWHRERTNDYWRRL